MDCDKTDRLLADILVELRVLSAIHRREPLTPKWPVDVLRRGERAAVAVRHKMEMD